MIERRKRLISWFLLIIYPIVYLPLIFIDQQWFPEFKGQFTPKDFVNYDTAYIPKGISTATPTPKLLSIDDIDKVVNRKKGMETRYVYYTTEYEYIGRYFITAYSPEECGYNGSNYPAGWVTSSDTICHQSDDWKTPNTCAIDRDYHKYGEILLIGDPNNPDNRRTVITEDTGPGVQGHWIDVFVDSYDQVINWNTRYDNVYRVKYIEHEITIEELLDSCLKGDDVWQIWIGQMD